MATNPRRNPPHVLAGEAPNGVAQVVITQMAIIFAIVATYIGMWMVFDDSAMLPWQSVKAAPQPGLPIGIVHKIEVTKTLQDIREREAKILNSYGVSDQSAGLYTIPVDRAMALMVQRGWPTDKSAFEQTSTKVPTDAAP